MDMRALIHDHTDFLLHFFQLAVSAPSASSSSSSESSAVAIGTGGSQKNAALSPISVSIVVAMVASGAKGPTLQQILSTINLPSSDTLREFASQVHAVLLADATSLGGPLLEFANSVWVQQTLPLNPSFTEVLHSNYGVAVHPADFLNQAEKSRGEINAWVKQETKSKIDEILPSGALNENTKLVLANALYFKGTWQKKFEASQTKDGDFYLLNGETISIPMMTTKKKQEISSHDSFKVLRLPYSNGQDVRSFSMYIILPNEKTGLFALEKGLTVDILEKTLVKGVEIDVGSFKLPKFKVSAGYEVPDTLKEMGMKLPFSDEADFSGMVDTSNGGHALSISNVFHKTFIEVNEEGTEAAAATAGVITLRSFVRRSSEDFIADHPFMFVLKEDITGIIVFMGHVVNPLSTS